MEHNLERPLPPSGNFDAVVSSFAIHHLIHERKRSLYAEIYDLLNPGGVFCNLEHVASPTPELHEEFLRASGFVGDGRPFEQAAGLWKPNWHGCARLGFVDVDCHWKWRELALLTGRRS